MPYTPENNPYIPGDPYSYDLKWLVREIKQFETVINNIDDVILNTVVQVVGKHGGPVLFNNKADMIAADPENDTLVYLLGYNTPSDNGNGLYLITNDYDLLGSALYYFTVSTNKWAIYVKTGETVSPEMFDASTGADAFNVCTTTNAKTIIASGSYSIAAPVKLNPGQTLCGNGTITFDQGGSLELDNHCVVKNMNFEDTLDSYVLQGRAVFAENKEYITIKNNAFHNMHMGKTIALYLCENCEIDYNYIENYSYAGIILDDRNVNVSICYNTVKNGRLDYFNRYAISAGAFTDVATGPAENIIISHNNLSDDSPKWEAIDSHGIINSEISFNKISGFIFGISLNDPTSASISKNGDNIRITNNEIKLDPVTPQLCSGIIITITQPSSSTGITIENNNIDISNNTTTHTSGASGITLRSGGHYKNVVIRNNNIRNQASGIGLGGYLTGNVLIEGNDIYGQLTNDDYGIFMSEVAEYKNIVISGNLIGISGSTTRCIRGVTSATAGDTLIKIHDNTMEGTTGVIYNFDHTDWPRSNINSIIGGSQGDFVANSSYDGSVNMIVGWVYDGTNWNQIASA